MWLIYTILVQGLALVLASNLLTDPIAQQHYLVRSQNSPDSNLALIATLLDLDYLHSGCHIFLTVAALITCSKTLYTEQKSITYELPTGA